MIRPDAALLLRRWGEALAGGGAILLGLWLFLGARGLPAVMGGALVAIGAVLLASGVRRARFATDVASPGLVEVDEGRITYLGPVMGGSVEIDDVEAVTFRRTATGEAFWRIAHAAGPSLAIPEGAAGSERLLDALVALPGLAPGAMVRAVRRPGPVTVVVWRRVAPEDRRALT